MDIWDNEVILENMNTLDKEPGGETVHGEITYIYVLTG